MKKLVIITFIFLLIISCKNKPADTIVFNKQEMIDSVKVTLEKYFADVKQNGLNAELKYLDDSDDFFWVPPGSSTPINYDSVKTHLNKTATHFKMVDNKWETLTIKPLTAELVCYTGVISGVMVDMEDEKTEYRLIETGTMIKRKDGWKLFYGQTSIIQ